jgi:ABC-type antimicrobial peptide transport system permease subunit
MRVAPGAAADDAAALRRLPQVAQVWDRAALEAAQRSDPEQLSLESNLLIGFLAALALAVVGFVVHFLVVTRGRLSDYAILQANGMPRALIRRSLGAEQFALLAFSILAGTAIGLLLAWVLLPAIQVGTDLSQLVPPTVVTVDPAVAGGAVLIVAAAALVGGAVGSRLAGRFRLMDELRLLG